jgi:hypothetical protein
MPGRIRRGCGRRGKQFVFTPAEIDGKPARIEILYRCAFVEKVDLNTADFTGW